MIKRPFFKQVDWRKLVLSAGAILLAVFFYSVQIGSLVPGASSSELQQIRSAASGKELLGNPLNAPHRLPQYLLLKTGLGSIGSYRFVSVLFAILFIVLFYLLIRKWHSPRVAVIATVLVGSSSWLLGYGRNATSQILLLTWFFVLYTAFWFSHSKHSKIAPVVLLSVMTIALYVPSSPYIVAALGLWSLKGLAARLRYMKRSALVIGGLCGLLILSPLILAFIRAPHLISEWLLIPKELSLSGFWANIASLPATFFYESKANPEFWLGRLPVFDIFTGSMMLLGAYSYRYHLKMERTPLMALILILCILIIGMAGDKLTLLLLPFLSMLVAGGISFLLEQWFSVFPKNPVARTIGTTLVSIAVIATCSYHVSRYFIAWSNNPDTKATYSENLE